MWSWVLFVAWIGLQKVPVGVVCARYIMEKKDGDEAG